jgi:16S rRNA (guanine527-N7)-methyltransferase
MGDVHEVITNALISHEQAFATYFDMLVSWNERMNLTSITERQEVYVKHFEDSLLVTALEEWNAATESGSRIVDVGTGAGFPGIPLAICHPNLKFVLCDALQKRVQFLTAVVSELSLANVQVVHGRAEDLARRPDFRNAFDIVVARAVARLNVLAEITLPFVRAGGFAFAYKGPGVSDELTDGKRAMGQLGGQLHRIVEMSLPDDRGVRTMVVMQQTAPTPKGFPRKSGTPQRKPL